MTASVCVPTDKLITTETTVYFVSKGFTTPHICNDVCHVLKIAQSVKIGRAVRNVIVRMCCHSRVYVYVRDT